ncbi:hypothetical protein ABH920_001935 [Catenulispora sp. EB89]|uniref:hypothetical protein n=1 Tax=Catenulispora sp. EB89 TaxID=3156257 RepID=UPI0035152F0D
MVHRQATDLWREFGRAEASLRQHAAAVNSIRASELNDLVMLRSDRPKYVDTFLARDATASNRAMLVDTVLWDSSWNGPAQRSLFAALGSIETDTVVAAMPEYARRMLDQDPYDFDYTSALLLAWRYRQSSLVARLLSKLLSSDDPAISATATDFLEDHDFDEAVMEGLEPVDSASQASRFISAPRATEATNDCWEQYEISSAQYEAVVREIRDSRPGEVAIKAMGGIRATSGLGALISATMFGMPRQIYELLARCDSGFINLTIDQLEGIATTVPQYVVHAVLDLPQVMMELGLESRSIGFMRAVEQAYGMFDRFGWLTEPRSR